MGRNRAQLPRQLPAFWALENRLQPKWRDYSDSDTDRRSYAENQTASAEFDVARVLEKIGNPGTARLGMTPPHPRDTPTTAAA